MSTPHHERIEDPLFRQAVDLIDAGDLAGLSALLKAQPDLVCARAYFPGDSYFERPSLLAFVAENPVRHDRLPATIVEIADLLIAAGSSQDALDETVVLVASGRVAQEAGAQGPLIARLCEAGADGAGALMPALAHGEFGAVAALLEAGVPEDLPCAAATGGDLGPYLEEADPVAKHRALALAAQHGQAGAVATLLADGSISPDAFNPDGCHAHSTPLHQAALAGHEAVVEALLAAGARRDLRDKAHGGCPQDWARHGGHDRLVARLAP